VTSVPAPLFPTPPSIDRADLGLRVWFMHPLTMVDQNYGATNLTLAMANFLSGEADAAFMAALPSASGGYRYVHDWRLFKRYESEARSVLVRWGVEGRGRVRNTWLAIDPHASSIIRMGVSVGAAAMKMAGTHLELVPDVESHVRELKLRPA
jgi:hypothetical protein